MNRITLMLSAMLLAVACGTVPPKNPTTGDDQTCGLNEVECEELVGDAIKSTGTCCPRTTICGGHWPNVGCPVGYCCAGGYGASPQRRARPLASR